MSHNKFVIYYYDVLLLVVQNLDACRTDQENCVDVCYRNEPNGKSGSGRDGGNAKTYVDPQKNAGPSGTKSVVLA